LSEETITEEELTTFVGQLTANGVTLTDTLVIEELTKRGYGDMEKKKLVLRDYEMLYLTQVGKMTVLRGKKQVKYEDLVEEALERDSTAWTRFLVYRDLRSRGYVAKEGFGFGVDFRLYDRGDFGGKAARYVVFGLNEGTEKEAESFRKVGEDILKMGKEPILAVVERRGEIIYYKVSKWRPTKSTPK